MFDRICDLIRMRPPLIENGGLLSASGATVPTDGDTGYQTGCIFQHTDGGDGTALYINIGSNSSCNFDPVDTTIMNTTPGTLAASEAVVLGSGGGLSGSFTGAGADNWGFWQLTVTNPDGSTAMRGLRVNCNPADAATCGDTQALHGRVTVPDDASFASGSAVHPVFAWLITEAGAGGPAAGVMAPFRAIFDASTNDYSGLASGGESAIFYGQTWASAGTIDSGLVLVAGAGSTINSAIRIGGSGTFGTIFDFTDWGADTTLRLIQGGPKDSGATEHFGVWIGDAASTAAVQAAHPVAAAGSLYLSTSGALFICTANDTWQTVTST